MKFDTDAMDSFSVMEEQLSQCNEIKKEEKGKKKNMNERNKKTHHQ